MEDNAGEMRRASTEAANGRSLVVKHFKHRIQLGDLEQILDALGKAHQLELSAAISDSGKARHHFSDAGAVDIGNFRQIQQELLVAFGRQFPDFVTERTGAFTQGNSPGRLDHGHITHLAGRQFCTHFCLLRTNRKLLKLIKRVTVTDV